MALTELVTTLNFIALVLQPIDIEVALLITVYVDNIGALFLVNNHTTRDRVKHVWIFDII